MSPRLTAALLLALPAAARAAPDLVVTRFAAAAAGATVTYDITVCNRGDTAATFDLGYVADAARAPACGDAVDARLGVTLGAGACASAREPLGPFPAGAYRSWLVADPDCRVAEADETNNAAAAAFTAGAGTVNLTLSRLAVVPDGGAATYTFTLCRTGAEARPVTLEVWLDRASAPSCLDRAAPDASAEVTLPAGCTTVAATVTGLPDGVYRARALLDAACAVAESDEGDNARGARYAVSSRAAWDSGQAPLPGGPRQEVGVAALAGRIYVLGGFTPSRAATRAAEVYDPSTDTWTAVAPLPRAIHHVNVAAVGGKIYVVGGIAGGGADGTVRVFDPATGRWSNGAPLPAGRARAASGVAVWGGRIYVAGGQPGRAQLRMLDIYDPSRDRWTRGPDMPRGRNHLTAAAAGGMVYAIGGRGADTGGITGRVDAYDVARRRWVSRAPMPTARGGIGGALHRGRIYVFGGEGNAAHPRGIFAAVEVYDPVADRWSRLAGMPIPVHGIGAASLGDRIHIPGGATRQGFGAVATNQAFIAP